MRKVKINIFSLTTRFINFNLNRLFSLCFSFFLFYKTLLFCLASFAKTIKSIEKNAKSNKLQKKCARQQAAATQRQQRREQRKKISTN